MIQSTSSMAQSPADWILRGAVIHTGIESAPSATALAVTGSRLVYVGEDAGVDGWIGDETRLVDGSGMHVYPGLVDAHAHLASLGRALLEIRLEGAATLAETLERVAQGMRELPEGAWVRGRGWDQNDWPEQEYPTASDLDGVVGERPAYFRRVDGHAAWVSHEVLRLAGITRETQDPAGGRIIRRANGDPSGILIDNAVDLIDAVVPGATAEDLRHHFLKAQEACLAAGLTGMHDMGIGSEELAALRRLDDEGLLLIRVYGLLSDNAALWQQELPRGPQLAGEGKRLTVRGVKLYADGALGSRGAALLADYSDDPGNRGLLVTDPDSLRARAERATSSGYQVCIHAIGDRGNRIALDVLASLSEPVGENSKERAADRLRPRVEHCQVLHSDDIARFSQSGIIASMQPTHCTSDMPWAPDRLGPERVRGAYVWRDLLAGGARLAFGSDFPVESHDPRLGLHAAVTRQSAAGEPVEGWNADQRLTMDEAIAAFSAGAAYASFQENDLGALSVGRQADLTVFDRQLDAARPQQILDASVRATVVGGKIAFVTGSDEEIWAALAQAPR